ncbi:hypothetical protein ACS0TY_010987 [Phlomoides rotata]
MQKEEKKTKEDLQPSEQYKRGIEGCNLSSINHSSKSWSQVQDPKKESTFFYYESRNHHQY